ncbi:thioredoxin family protein [Actimicrobium antarcticum]|uniref:Thioredoxin domain-containing protein n=1 Tax=Actimicrobium antarcticum TaxID=1051899 RepID=A0ABP7TML9_9BURK
MSILNLNADNQSELKGWLATDDLLVACLCAAWCDVCRDYRAQFEALAERHRDKHFLWIDIEDQADLLGDFDVENFPTLLIQRGAQVAFFGSVQPGLQLADRLVQAQSARSIAELAVMTNPEHRQLQHFHLARRLEEGAD